MRKPLDPDMFDPVCPTDLTPLRLGNKWAGMIIRCLEQGPRRFSELRIPLRGVSAKALTQSLRALERDGLVARTVYDDPGRQAEIGPPSTDRLDLRPGLNPAAERVLSES